MRYFTALTTLIVLFSFNPVAANTHSTNLVRASTQYWSITDAAQTGLGFTSSFTLACWIRPTSAPSSGQLWQIIGKERNAGGEGIYQFIYQNSGGTLQLLTAIRDASSLETATHNVDLGTGTWKHLIWVHDGSTADNKYWIDGVNVASPTGTINPTTNNDPFAIGADAQGGGLDFNGDFDECLAYSIAVSDTIAGNLYSDPCTPSTTNLVSRWAFDNDAGVDQTANNNDLTNNNSATFSTDKAFTCAGGGFDWGQVI